MSEGMSHKAANRYSDWFQFDQLEAMVPERCGIFQVKQCNGLVTYPTGKSAMVFYGYAEKLRSGLLLFRSDVLPALGLDASTLRFRFMPAEDYQDRFKQHVSRFCATFGALPIGNETLLNPTG